MLESHGDPRDQRGHVDVGHAGEHAPSPSLAEASPSRPPQGHPHAACRPPTKTTPGAHAVGAGGGGPQDDAGLRRLLGPREHRPARRSRRRRASDDCAGEPRRRRRPHRRRPGRAGAPRGRSAGTARERLRARAPGRGPRRAASPDPAPVRPRPGSAVRAAAATAWGRRHASCPTGVTPVPGGGRRSGPPPRYPVGAQAALDDGGRSSREPRPVPASRGAASRMARGLDPGGYPPRGLEHGLWCPGPELAARPATPSTAREPDPGYPDRARPGYRPREPD